MRLVSWTVRLLLFLVLAGLAAKNVEPVTLRFYFDTVLQAPLVIVLFCAFLLGAVLGMLALLGTLLRQRREISRIKNQSKIDPAAPPI
ncbi:MAG: LapA family protein [Clostridia bacterium]